MGCGILEDTKLEHVPGTAQFTDDPNAAAAALYKGLDLHALKHGTGRHADIVLVPQPSDDPNDPLNWPPIKKHLFFFTLTYGTVLAGALGPIVASAQTNMAVIFGVPLQTISYALSTALVAMLAVSTIVGAACSVKFGKRPVYLVSTLLMFVGVLVSSQANGYGQLLGGRIIQGAGQASLEFLGGSSIADVYFVHERGLPVAVWTLSLLNGINVTPPISGQIFDHLGWRWNFRIFAFAAFSLFVLQFFCMPESTYDRSGYVPAAVSGAAGGSRASLEGDKPTEERLEAAAPQGLEVPAKRSFLSELAVYRGVLDREQSFFWLMWQNIAMLVSPVVLFAILTYGLAVTFCVVVATASAQIFAGLYDFGPAGVGNSYVSPLIADFIGAALVGPLSDFAVAFLAKRNRGVFEPEFRLLPLAFYLVFGAMGFIGFGLASDTESSPWGPIVFLGLLNFGITVGCSAVVAYVVDCHRHTSDAALGAVVFGKNALSTILTCITNVWMDRGIKNAFVEMGGLAIATSLLTVPMYIYGKRVRSWLSRKLHFEKDDKTVVN